MHLRRAAKIPKDIKKQSQSQWSTIQISEDKRKKLIKDGLSHKPMRTHEVHQVRDIWSLSQKNRWKLYKYWVNKYLGQQKKQLAAIGQLYDEACEVYNKCQREIDTYVMRGADVIGITTTGAAKHHQIFKHLYPKILIIEEAAEVFEAHVVSSLAPSVQQLVLIGDHKQLRPKPNSYELEKRYGLDISLFERLAINNLRVVSLSVQHRMRPDVADLIRPCIYDNLLDNTNVLEYDSVLGIGKNVFAIDHQEAEESSDVHDLRSHSNRYEADYLVALCKYLLKQGYEPSQITVLTMYRGQLLELKKRMRRTDFQGVRVAAVDDFQGEENDIILLSLVRSNSDGKIGFLSIDNRVCVSLSRAKKGLYIIGNFSMLRDKHKTVWPQVLATLEQKQSIGEALPLYCQLHPKTKVAAQTPQDFLKCPEGGCLEQCGTRLQCGHMCTRLCHPYDREHAKYKCKKPCSKTLLCGHQCKYICYECKEGCQACFEVAEKKIPLCGHIVPMPCSADPTLVKCPVLCSKLLPCGHMCQESCSSPCTRRCSVKVTKLLPCGHKVKAFCYKDPEKIRCPQPCAALLDCEHKCSGTCSSCYNGRLHVRCSSKCGRNLMCGHICDFPCTPQCPPCLKECKNYCFHTKCPKRCYEPCVPCMEPCKWECEHLRCSKRCGELCDRPPCNQPCKKQLSKCGHQCIGLCNEKCPSKCRKCDKDEVCEIFFGDEDEPDARFIQLHDCGHIFEVQGLDQWMKQQDADKTGSVEVKFNVCPKCKTEIRKSVRYGNAIKQTLSDYEEIKKKQLTFCENDLVMQFRNVHEKVKKSPHYSAIEEELNSIKNVIKPSDQTAPILFPHHINTLQAQLTLLPLVVKVSEQLDDVKEQCMFSTSACVIKKQDIQNAVQNLLKFFMQEFLSNQQISDAQCEIRRLSCVTKLCDLSTKLTEKSVMLSSQETAKLDLMAKDVYDSGLRTDKMSEIKESDVCTLITKISERYNVTGLTDKQRIEIVNAIGLSKGHWYKCPNGHFYTIGECGGAMETSKCPDCGATIGGQSHALASGNAHAPEMDNSQYAAWSEAANLQNFDPQELQRMFQQ